MLLGMFGIIFILLLFAAAPFMDIALGVFSAIPLLPNIRVLVVGLGGALFALPYALLGAVLSGLIDDVLFLRSGGVSAVVFAIGTLLARVLRNQWFSLMVPQGRLLFSGVVSFTGVLLFEWSHGLAVSLLPLLIVRSFATTILLFLILSVSERLSARNTFRLS